MREVGWVGGWGCAVIFSSQKVVLENIPLHTFVLLHIEITQQSKRGGIVRSLDHALLSSLYAPHAFPPQPT